MNAVYKTHPQEFLKENPQLIVGLDTQEGLRLVLAEVTDDCPEPTVVEHHCFRSLEGLQRYLRPVRNRIQAVSVQAKHGDPLGIIAWLSTHKVPIHHYHNPGWSGDALELQDQLEFWELPRSYQLAYTLAFLSSYRLHSEKTVYKLWQQTYQLKEILNEYDRELARLSHALGKDGVRPTLQQWLCPF